MSGFTHGFTHGIGNILLVGASNFPVLLEAIAVKNQAIQPIALLLGCGASIAVIIDSCFKIHWKYTQNKKNKHERKQQQSTRNEHQA